MCSSDLHERRPALLVDAVRNERIADGRMVGERRDDAHDVRVAEKDQASVAVVVGECAERLGADGHLRVHGARGFEGGGHGPVGNVRTGPAQ